MRKVNFSGSLEECLKHASENYDFETLCNLMVEFTGQNKKTVSRWLHKGKETNVPKSLNGIKARHFLEILGYKISDINSVNHSSIINFGRHIGFGLLSIEKATEDLNLSNTTKVVRIILGKSGLSVDRLETIANYNYKFRSELLKKITYWDEKVGFCQEGSDTNESEDDCLDDIPEIVVDEHEAILCSLSNSLKNVLYLGELVASNAFTAEERQSLRDISGRDTVLAVSTVVIKLSGERARRRSIERSKSAF